MDKFNQIVISSQNIADIIGVEHSKVQKIIEAQISSGDIKTPASQVYSTKNIFGIKTDIKVYMFSGKEGMSDSMTVACRANFGSQNILKSHWLSIAKHLDFEEFKSKHGVDYDLIDLINGGFASDSQIWEFVAKAIRATDTLYNQALVMINNYDAEEDDDDIINAEAKQLVNEAIGHVVTAKKVIEKYNIEGTNYTLNGQIVMLSHIAAYVIDRLVQDKVDGVKSLTTNYIL